MEKPTIPAVIDVLVILEKRMECIVTLDYRRRTLSGSLINAANGEVPDSTR